MLKHKVLIIKAEGANLQSISNIWNVLACVCACAAVELALTCRSAAEQQKSSFASFTQPIIADPLVGQQAASSNFRARLMDGSTINYPIKPVWAVPSAGWGSHSYWLNYWSIPTPGQPLISDVSCWTADVCPRISRETIEISFKGASRGFLNIELIKKRQTCANGKRPAYESRQLERPVNHKLTTKTRKEALLLPVWSTFRHYSLKRVFLEKKMQV